MAIYAYEYHDKWVTWQWWSTHLSVKLTLSFKQFWAQLPRKVLVLIIFVIHCWLHAVLQLRLLVNETGSEWGSDWDWYTAVVVVTNFVAYGCCDLSYHVFFLLVSMYCVCAVFSVETDTIWQWYLTREQPNFKIFYRN